MKQGSPGGLRFCMALLLMVGSAGAAAFDPTKLPTPASKKVDFATDIKPILESSCLRCHGPERPKSEFRLTERASALKGGTHGVDIVPGNSAGSALVAYAARLVPDMEMPPEGKGEPLSSEQVGLLRAWIDQGLGWDESSVAVQSRPSFDLSPFVSWTAVSGDRAQFRDLEWQPEGWNGGAEQFGFHQRLPDGRSVSLDGHAGLDDYKLALDLRKPDLGFARLNFEQFRKYYNDSGGYAAAFTPSLYRLGNDLHLDVGRAAFELGLTLPDLPRIVLGYEHQYRDGAKSMLTWGPVLPPTGNFLDIRNFYPGFKEIQEHTHIVTLNVSYETHGFELENNVRAEFYSSDTVRTDALNVPVGALFPNVLTRVSEGHRYDQVADTVRVQKPITDWWFAGAGYRYSWLDGDASLHLTPTDGAGQGTAGSAWSADKILLDEAWHIANLNSQFVPLPELSATLGLQGQWKHQDTFGDVNMDEVVDPADPTSGIFRFPALEESALDQTTAEEMALLRYSGLPYTALFAQAALKQENYTRTAAQQPGPHFVDLASEAAARWQDYRVGFNSSPWSRISFGGDYRHRDRLTDYDYPFVQREGGAYPGFIHARDVKADEAEARLGVQLAKWAKTSLTYRWGGSEFKTTTFATSPAVAGTDSTPGGTVVAGHYQAHTFSANITLTPFRRLYLSTTASYQNSRTTTFDNGSAAVVPYAGNLWTLFANATVVLDEETDLFVGYSFSLARYGQHNELAGLPVGLDYDRHGIQAGLSRRLNRVASVRAQYAYFSYNEPTSAHFRDFTAHQILAVLALKF